MINEWTIAAYVLPGLLVLGTLVLRLTGAACAAVVVRARR